MRRLPTRKWRARWCTCRTSPEPGSRSRRPRNPRASSLYLLFIIDPLDSLKAYKDSSVAMMRAAQARGHGVHFCEQASLHWAKNRVAAGATRLSLTDNDEDWYRKHESQRSEEHTSELQSRLHLVCRLLLEKKKTTIETAWRNCCITPV